MHMHGRKLQKTEKKATKAYFYRGNSYNNDIKDELYLKRDIVANVIFCFYVQNEDFRLPFTDLLWSFWNFIRNIMKNDDNEIYSLQ